MTFALDSWKMEECLGEEESPVGTMFYPDWSGINKGCLSNDQQSPPQYMKSNPDFWMHATLEECCEANYHYMLNDCLGTSSTGSTKWYMDFSSWECVQDCEGASPCGGFANFWDIMYDTKQKCCGEREWWNTAACAQSSG